MNSIIKQRLKGEMHNNRPMPMQKAPYTQQDIAFIKHFFGSKRDLSFRLSWKHAAEAAQYLKNIAHQTKEIDALLLRSMCTACLGHDLLEDTSATKSDIKKQWGDQTLSLIQHMTNTQGDSDFKDYIAHLRKAPEEALLIKFADIYSNITNSVKKFDRMDTVWIRTFWLPLVKKYQKNLLSRPCARYPKTGNAIRKDIETYITLLEKKLIQSMP